MLSPPLALPDWRESAWMVNIYPNICVAGQKDIALDRNVVISIAHKVGGHFGKPENLYSREFGLSPWECSF